MRLLYFIKDDTGWHRADYETYMAFDGEKEIRPPHYGMILLQNILEPLRWY